MKQGETYAPDPHWIIKTIAKLKTPKQRDEARRWWESQDENRRRELLEECPELEPNLEVKFYGWLAAKYDKEILAYMPKKKPKSKKK